MVVIGPEERRKAAEIRARLTGAMFVQSERFVEEHRQARLAFTRGEVNVTFPQGTYRFVQEFGARCAET